jgi:hypothetical protein
MRAAKAAAAAEDATTADGRELHQREAVIHEHAVAVHDEAVHLQDEHLEHLQRQNVGGSGSPNSSQRGPTQP